MARDGTTRYNVQVKLKVRRIGNSLGVIVPKATLDRWGVREGGSLELADSCIRPVSKRARESLDELKRRIAMEVVSRFSAPHIRAHSLANLHRWRENGAWVTAYDEWQVLLEAGDDGALFDAMLGRNERANRLRQSPPYVGMLSKERVRELNEEVSA